MINVFSSIETRKVFVNVSHNDTDLDSGLYGQAPKAYGTVGFAEECTHDEYYARGGSLLVMGLRLEDFDAEPLDDDLRGAQVTDADEIVETDDSYFIEWAYRDGSGSDVREVDRLLSKIRRWGGRVAFAGVPANATGVIDVFLTSGFKEDGRLLDFYEDGVDEIRLRFNL